MTGGQSIHVLQVEIVKNTVLAKQNTPQVPNERPPPPPFLA